MSKETELESVVNRYGISFDDDDNGSGDPFVVVTNTIEEDDDGNVNPLDVEEDPIEEEEGSLNNETEEGETEEFEEEGEDSDVEGEDDDASLYWYIQKELKKEGFIDESQEFDKKVDGMTVYNAYKEKIRADIESEVRQAAVEALMAQGYNENDLLVAQAIRSGFDTRLLTEASMYEVYASMDDDTDYDDKISVITQMYRQRGFTEDEVQSQIDKAEQDDKVDEYFSKSKSFFNNKFGEFKETVRQQEEIQRKNAEQVVKNAEALINRVVTSQELFGEKLTPSQAKELNDSIRTTSHMVEVEGVKHRVSELQKFILDFQNDPEFRLYAFKLFKFRDSDKGVMKSQAKREVEEEFFKGYKQRVIKSEKLQEKIKKSELSQQKQGTRFLLDLDE